MATLTSDVSLRSPLRKPIPNDYPSISTRPHLRVRHPGYRHNNTLLDLVPTDGDGDGGIHFALLHTACAIIANNRFDGWLSGSADGTAPKIAPDNDNALVPTGDYYFHVPPSAPRAPASLPVTAPSFPLAPPPPREADDDIYPITPNFRSWPFPHSCLPAMWRETAAAAPESAVAGPTASIVQQRDRTCRLSDYTDSTELAHIIPGQEKDWFAANAMFEYCTSESRAGQDLIGSESNVMLLRGDIHTLWDRMRFSVVPKKSDGQWTLAAHLMGPSQELHAAYHNRPLQRIQGIPAEFWFARFAWDIFPNLRGFLQSRQKRRLAVCQQDGSITVREYSSDDCLEFCQAQGRFRSVSSTKRKRGNADGTPAAERDSDSAVSGLGKYSHNREADDGDDDGDDEEDEEDPYGRKRSQRNLYWEAQFEADEEDPYGRKRRQRNLYWEAQLEAAVPGGETLDTGDEPPRGRKRRR